MTQTTKSSKELIAELEAAGKKTIGEITQKEWDDYCALSKEAIHQIQRESKPWQRQ